MLEGQLIENPCPFLPDRPGTTAEIVTPLPADQTEIDRESLRFALPNKLCTLPDNVAVKSAAQSAITCDDEDFDFLSLAFLKQRMGGA